MNAGKKYADQGFTEFLNRLKSHKVLSREEEKELCLKYKQTRDKKIFDKLVLCNVRFIAKACWKFSNNGIPLSDLFQHGVIGLMKGIEEFDPDRGFRLLSFARWWIEAYIKRCVIDSYSLVKIGTTADSRVLFFRMRQIESQLIAEHGFADPEKVCEIMNANKKPDDKTRIKPKSVIELRGRLNRDLSVDCKLGDDPDSGSMNDFLASEDPMQDETTDRKRRIENLRHYISFIANTKLTVKERDILNRRLLAEEPETLQEIAATHNVSRERIRQIEVSTKEKLKKLIPAEMVV
jgi:RNA polymerase sigma-32 factor